MTAKMIQDICAIVKENKTLKSLNLSWNQMVNPIEQKYTFSNVEEAKRLKEKLKEFQRQERRAGAKSLAEAVFANLSTVEVSK